MRLQRRRVQDLPSPFMRQKHVCKSCEQIVHAIWNHHDWSRRIAVHKTAAGVECENSRQLVSDYCKDAPGA